MSTTPVCSSCNANIAGDAFSCPCGVFYHPGCANLAINNTTGKRKCCSYKTTSRSLSPSASNKVTIKKISQLLNDHYAKANNDSEKFITEKLDSVMAPYASKLNDVEDRVDSLEVKIQEFQDAIDRPGHSFNSDSKNAISAKCVSEIINRQNRGRNLIMFDCPEITDDGKLTKDFFINLEPD